MPLAKRIMEHDLSAYVAAGKVLTASGSFDSDLSSLLFEAHFNELVQV